MYFPYLRGRQFELIALRELCEHDLIRNKIFPIIEPVKLSSTLTKTLDMFRDKNKNVSLIMNPCVGKITYDIINNEGDPVCKNIKSFFDSHVLSKKAFHLESCLKNYEEDLSNIILIVKQKEYLKLYNDIYNRGIEPLYTLMLDESDFRRTIRNENRVYLSDNFNKQDRNANYKNESEFYSDEHLFYNKDGYVGFSDFSVVGDEYVESGFAPYAVAIHIVYFDQDSVLRVMHFVSDSNEDYSDTTKKFREALEKMIEWNRTMKLDTFAMKEFERLYENESYPGLGTVKKLSIMHHLQLMSDFLDSRE